MAVQHRAYLLGPPVSSAREINRLVELLLSRWTGKEIRNFLVISVDGPVLYKSDWVKTTTAAAAGRRPSMQGCDLWSLQFSSSDLHLDTGLSLSVQDAKYYRLPHDQRLNSTPEYETFLFSIHSWCSQARCSIPLEHRCVHWLGPSNSFHGCH